MPKFPAHWTKSVRVKLALIALCMVIGSQERLSLPKLATIAEPFEQLRSALDAANQE